MRLGQQVMRLWPVSDDKIGLEYKLKRLLEGSLMPAEPSHVYWNGTFSDAEKRRLVPDALARRTESMSSAIFARSLAATATT